MASSSESLFSAIESVPIHSFLETTFNANIVFSTRFQKFYVSFERATIKNGVAASYSVSFTKYAARRLLTELPGILDKLEQYELRQAQEQHNASASASVSTHFNLLEPNGEQKAARGEASGGAAAAFFDSEEFARLVKQLEEEMSPNLLNTSLQEITRMPESSKERVESAPREGGGKQVPPLKVTIPRKRSCRSAVLKRSRLKAANAIASKRRVLKSATEPAPILTGPDATELANLIYTTVIDSRFSSTHFYDELSSSSDTQLSEYRRTLFKKHFLPSLQAMLAAALEKSSSRTYINTDQIILDALKALGF